MKIRGVTLLTLISLILCAAVLIKAPLHLSSVAILAASAYAVLFAYGGLQRLRGGLLGSLSAAISSLVEHKGATNVVCIFSRPTASLFFVLVSYSHSFIRSRYVSLFFFTSNLFCVCSAAAYIEEI